MNASSYFSFAKSTLFFSALVLSLASCKKENVQPTESASTYEAPSSVKPQETVMPGTTDHKIVDGDQMKQISLDQNVSTNDSRIVDPQDSKDRFKQVSENDQISIQARPGRGTSDPSRFRKVGLIKKDTPL